MRALRDEIRSSLQLHGSPAVHKRHAPRLSPSRRRHDVSPRRAGQRRHYGQHNGRARVKLYPAVRHTPLPPRHGLPLDRHATAHLHQRLHHRARQDCQHARPPDTPPRSDKLARRPRHAGRRAGLLRGHPALHAVEPAVPRRGVGC
ncbi:hypothetical protein BN1708_018863 [Verticillium longisporum]|uniref:Uncharacterized protein n=1 Tax=Verticillium longisporum TaxID=100787 RepID=A0A0G4MD88_VERLO|nr:hypothetical protein BN1708_018863 [Verticillium longisporum]